MQFNFLSDPITWSHVFFDDKATHCGMGKLKIGIHFEFGYLVSQIQKCFRIHVYSFFEILPFFPSCWIFALNTQILRKCFQFKRAKTEATLLSMITKITIYFSFLLTDWGKVCIERSELCLSHVLHLPGIYTHAVCM